MGNQNTTPVTEDDKSVNEAPGNSTNENHVKDDQLISAATNESADNDHEDDQALDHIKDEGVDSLEAYSNETKEIENQAFDIKDDDDVDDQEIEDSTAEAPSESDALLNLNDEGDDHVLEKINEERTETSSTEDEEEEKEEAEEQEDNSSNVEEVVLDSEDLKVTSLEELETKDENIEQIEVVKDVMDKISHLEIYDHDDTNNLDSLHGSEEDETENFYEFAGKSEEKNSCFDHVDHYKDLEIAEEEKDAGKCSDAAEFKDLEVVDSKEEHEKPRSQIEKSLSFNFEFVNLTTEKEESDQTPMLYHNKNSHSPMRSLSTPVNARFSSDETTEERTINTVDYDQKPRSPLNGLFKDQEEETHMLNHQKIQQEPENTEISKNLCNGHEIEAPLQEESREKRNKSSRVSGSFFFSSCICCSGVQELADP